MATMPRRVRVLVVDDDESVRHALVRILGGAGYEVEAVEDGEKALQRVRTAGYDCIMTDFRMPVMDGCRLFQAIKMTNPSLAKRVIFCTGETATPYLQWFLEGSGSRVLPKPFRMSQVLELCGEVCRLERMDIYGHKEVTG